MPLDARDAVLDRATAATISRCVSSRSDYPPRSSFGTYLVLQDVADAQRVQVPNTQLAVHPASRREVMPADTKSPCTIASRISLQGKPDQATPW